MENEKAINILTKILREAPVNQEEREYIDEWRKENDINQNIYTFTITKTSIDSLPENSIEYQAIYKRITNSIEKGKSLSETEQMNMKRKAYSFSNLWKYAAIFAIGVLSATTTLYLMPVRDTVALSEITVPKGSVSEIMLPDSSFVTINSNSKLSFSNDFLNGKRDVTLEGEAFFKVKKQLNGNEFTVHSKGTSIIVKGTEFNVRAYQDSPDIEATLMKGAIVFCANKRSIPLKPDQQLTYNTDSQKIVIRKANAEDTEWRSGKYTFKDMSLKEVIPIFNRIYGTNVVLEKGVGDIVFSGYLDRKNPISHSLDVISLTTGIHYQIINDTIYIK